MKKDIIYIDVEDDITTIIGKLKATSREEVALVPPKRMGVLQSAVNLRLIARAAKQQGKQLSLVTNNHALLSLASAAAIPVAKTIQAEPTLVASPNQADGPDDDVIDGATLPIGEHEAHGIPMNKAEKRGEAMAAALSSGAKPKNSKKKPVMKVPNFDKFRKKMVIGILLFIAFIAFCIWAFFFAARATVVVNAKTEATSVNVPIQIKSEAKTDIDAGIVSAEVKKESEERSTDGTATGKKDVGEKATGTVEYSNSSIQSTTVSAGQTLKTSGGLSFITTESVEVPGASLGNCQGQACVVNGTASGGVEAAEKGSKYNAAEGNLTGASGVSAKFTGPTSGGVSKIVQVITEADVQKAKQAIADEKTSEIKAKLKESFGDNAIILEDSFKVSYDDVSTNPAVGKEANTFTLSATANYSMYGVDRSSISEYLDTYLEEQIKGLDNQKVYDNGSDKADFQDIATTKNGATATLIATAQVGPVINQDEVKDRVKGLRYAEVREELQQINGIENVDVHFFPFWVSTVPEDPAKITIEFKIDDKN